MSSSSPNAALLYLFKRTAANRLRSQLRRVRNPRYVFAVIVGVLYIWLALFRNTRVGNGPLSSIVDTTLFAPIIAAFLLLAAGRWWLFGSDRSALAFLPAEVQFLFPAPVSRRTLVHAKLLRNQFAILLNTLIWTILLRGGAQTPDGWRRGIALWLLFSTLSLHRLGASIVRANAIDNDGAGRKRSIIPVVIFGALIAAVAFGLVTEIDSFRVANAQGYKAIGAAVVDALGKPIPRYALWPVRALLNPIFAPTYAAWLAAIPLSLLILLAHYLWVVRLDHAFEEAALEASQHRAERLLRFRTSQLGKARSRKGKLARIPSMAIRGRPELAIVWKNVAAAIRGGAWRTQLVSFTIGLAVFAAVTKSASNDAANIFVGVAFGWAAMLLFVGPLWMRFDLRLDLTRLAILKTFPLTGRSIVLAEIIGVSVLHTLTIWSLLTVPLVMIFLDQELAIAAGANVPRFLAVIVAVPVFNFLMFTIQNATALLFPAWVRLGTESRGFETMGQNLLTTGATALVAGIALVLPIGIAVALVFGLGTSMGDWVYLVATILAGAAIIAEIWPLLAWLGKVFERTDESEVLLAA